MTIKTPLKWVGSKVRLMPQLRDHLPVRGFLRRHDEYGL